MRYPELSVLTEFNAETLWFPIPGMYGGFKIVLENERNEIVLIAESWCRVIGGSGMRHRTTNKAYLTFGENIGLLERPEKEAKEYDEWLKKNE